MRPRQLRGSRGATRMAGLSLVELMIAIALGLIIVAAMVAVFANTSVARNEIERMSRQIENGRFAIEILSSDLRLAGYYGGLDLVGASPAVTVPTSIDPAVDTASDPCSTSDTDREKAFHLHVQGYNNTSAAPGTCVMTDLKANSDILVVRRSSTCVAGVAGCEGVDANRHYLQVSLCNEIPQPPTHILSLGSVAPTLKRKTCGADLVGVREHLVHAYYIRNDNSLTPPRPVLMRLEFKGNAGWVQTPLVEGIEQINIDYGIDYKDAAGVPCVGKDCDGVPDAYHADPSGFAAADCPLTCTPVNNWRNVVTARVYVLARNIDPSPGFVDSKSYDLGSLAVGAQSDNFRRHVYTALVRVNNPAGRRDKP